MYNILKLCVISIFVLPLFVNSIVAEDDIPQDVQDMINTFTTDVKKSSGLAAQSLQDMEKQGFSPYDKKVAKPSYDEANIYKKRAVVPTVGQYPKIDYPTPEEQEKDFRKRIYDDEKQMVLKIKQKSVAASSASAPKKPDVFNKAKFFLDFKVISCHKEKLPSYIKVSNHEACGGLDSQVLFKGTEPIYLTKEGRFNNLKPKKIIRTVPKIKIDEAGNYVIKDEKTLNTVKLGVELFAKPTTIVGNKVKLDLAVRTVELADDSEEIFIDSNDKNFINNGIGFKHRFLSASFPVSLNQSEILGGNSAILAPKTKDLSAKSSYPESARLWLEVNLRMPPKIASNPYGN